ncbi:hypothetical protein CsatA_028819 [Cannabis sativa]
MEKSKEAQQNNPNHHQTPTTPVTTNNNNKLVMRDVPEKKTGFTRGRGGKHNGATKNNMSLPKKISSSL